MTLPTETESGVHLENLQLARSRSPVDPPTISNYPSPKFKNGIIILIYALITHSLAVDSPCP